ncbi:Uncharacterized protein GBIM_17954, partial [Gryllus bimaculatus]
MSPLEIEVRSGVGVGVGVGGVGGGMWTAVAPPADGSAPASRAKHSATLLGGHVYLLGGRNGNLPLKDLWRYSL